MAPIIHCIRHGQGLHNVAGGSYHLRDPDLTALGAKQCSQLRDSSFPEQSKISLVLASPLRRTLHSAILIFASGSSINPQPPFSASMERTYPHRNILAMPDLQETSDDPCDIGSDPEQLRDLVAEKNWPVDLSLVREGWNVKTALTRYSPHSIAISNRARTVRVFLRQQLRSIAKDGEKDAEIALVTHGSFLHFLTDDWEDADRDGGTGWRNCETRSYVLERDLFDDEDMDARLTEITASRTRRGKIESMPGNEEQPRLFAAAMQHWESAGLQRPDKMPVA